MGLEYGFLGIFIYMPLYAPNTDQGKLTILYVNSIVCYYYFIISFLCASDSIVVPYILNTLWLVILQ